jgi:hypothetical protein
MIIDSKEKAIKKLYRIQSQFINHYLADKDKEHFKYISEGIDDVIDFFYRGGTHDNENTTHDH